MEGSKIFAIVGITALAGIGVAYLLSKPKKPVEPKCPSGFQMFGLQCIPLKHDNIFDDTTGGGGGDTSGGGDTGGGGYYSYGGGSYDYLAASYNKA